MNILPIKPCENEDKTLRQQTKSAPIFSLDYINNHDLKGKDNDAGAEAAETRTSLGTGVVDQVWRHYFVVRLMGGTLLQRNPNYDTSCKNKRETQSLPFVSSSFSSIASVWAMIIRFSFCLLSVSLFIIYGEWFTETRKTNSLDVWLTGAMQFMFSLVDMWTTAYIWWSSKAVLEFQNKWEQYQTLYEKKFILSIPAHAHAHAHDPKDLFPGSSYYSAHDFNLTTKMEVVYVMTFLSALATSASFFLVANSPVFTTHYFVYTILVSACVGADEVHALLVYASLSESYKHVGMGISRDLTYLKSNMTLKNLDLSKIIGWKEMIQLIRKQIDLASRFQSPMMFVKIAMLMFCSTLALDTIFSAVQGNTEIGIIRNAGLILVNSALRVLLQLYFTNLICSEEKKVVEILSEIHTASLTLDLNARLELKDLTDMMRNDPKRIVFFGIIVVDIKLLLTISNVVVTYLIVLLQLRASQTN